MLVVLADRFASKPDKSKTSAKAANTPSSTSSTPLKSPGTREINAKRLSFFDAPTEPVRIDPFAFLGLKRDSCEAAKAKEEVEAEKVEEEVEEVPDVEVEAEVNEDGSADEVETKDEHLLATSELKNGAVLTSGGSGEESLRRTIHDAYRAILHDNDVTHPLSNGDVIERRVPSAMSYSDSSSGNEGSFWRRFKLNNTQV